jgi:hypothetical protein
VRDCQLQGYAVSGQSLRLVLHQQPQDVEAGGLSEGREGKYDVLLLHISKLMESTGRMQAKIGAMWPLAKSIPGMFRNYTERLQRRGKRIFIWSAQSRL